MLLLALTACDDPQPVGPDRPADSCAQQTWYPDGDGDGYGDEAGALEECARPEGYVDRAGDCDDNDQAVSPEGIESCDEVDEDCDDAVDEGAGDTWYIDADGDGYGDPDSPVQACEQPSDAVVDNTDCNDATPETAPGRAEDCEDGVDRDCDGLVDCEDGDCVGERVCEERDCLDGIDNDGNGFADLDDSACWTPCDADAGSHCIRVNRGTARIGFTGRWTERQGSSPSMSSSSTTAQRTNDIRLYSLVGLAKVYTAGGEHACSWSVDRSSATFQTSRRNRWRNRWSSSTWLTTYSTGFTTTMRTSFDTSWLRSRTATSVGGPVHRTGLHIGSGCPASFDSADFPRSLGPSWGVLASGGQPWLLPSPYGSWMEDFTSWIEVSSGSTWVADRAEVAGVLVLGRMQPGTPAVFPVPEPPSSSLPEAATASLEGSGSGGELPWTADLADLDGDGVVDLVVVAPSEGSDQGGTVWGFAGPLEGELAVGLADWTLEGGTRDHIGEAVAALGDLDGDGAADIAVAGHELGGSTWIFYGPLSSGATLASAGAVFDEAGSVHAVGDFDGDGLDDVLVDRLVFTQTPTGAVDSVDHHLRVHSLDDWDEDFPRASGDWNGDGLADVAFAGQPSSYTTFVWFGPTSGYKSASTADRTLYGGRKALAGAGDIDGDGVDDLVSGMADSAQLFAGPLTGGSVSITSAGWKTGFGSAVLGLGDLDDDGDGELAIAAEGVGDAAGAVYLFHGPLSGSLSDVDADLLLVGDGPGEWVGHRMVGGAHFVVLGQERLFLVDGSALGF